MTHTFTTPLSGRPGALQVPAIGGARGSPL